DPILDKRSLVVAISQSGETADTLTAIRNAKAKGAKVLAITNVVDSSIARESDAVLYTYTGPEIGVAATKTFTAQIATLHLVGLLLGRKKGTFKKEEAEAFLHELLEVPGKIEEVLKQSEAIRELALKYAHSDDCLFIGRGPQFPIALEGALKLKEISYLHAEGYPAGELKHGPIALIDHGSPVVAIALKDEYYEKMASNIQEVLSRQAAVLALATEGDKKIRELTGDVIYLPKAHPLLTPILSAVPLQLFAYYIADHRGHDVDQPRNLAKSVTVE
ncbi:MAG: isomerizing glutamine--fructose-6-phosphate transaminase, partial [Deltaproteobacteria bacterium]|nr:isomerizing glutamine--fructose-6-phosphate transaminase [Deltaproteobacteria bacterium]